MQLIDNIIKIMEKKGIKAYQLEKAGIVKQTTFTSWKKGIQPASDKIISIMQYLEVTPNELFGYPTDQTLSEDELELIKCYRELPEKEKYKILGRIEALLENYRKGE